MNTQSQDHSDATASLFVGDLHHDVTEATLFQKFSAAGPVLSVRVCRDMVTRRSLGYAYVNFQSRADAEKALHTMNFDPIYDQPIRIMWSQRDPTMRKSGVGNVFIKNLDPTIDNKELRDMFTAFGNISSCKVTTPKYAGIETSQGFVHFDSEESAEAAIKKMNGRSVKGRVIYVGRFIPRKERMQIPSMKGQNFTNVYIDNIPEGMDDEELLNMCRPFGKVLSAKVMKNGGSIFAIVSCEDHASAESIKKQVGNFPEDSNQKERAFPGPNNSQRLNPVSMPPLMGNDERLPTQRDHVAERNLPFTDNPRQLGLPPYGQQISNPQIELSEATRHLNEATRHLHEATAPHFRGPSAGPWPPYPYPYPYQHPYPYQFLGAGYPMAAYGNAPRPLHQQQGQVEAAAAAAAVQAYHQPLSPEQQSDWLSGMSLTGPSLHPCEDSCCPETRSGNQIEEARAFLAQQQHQQALDAMRQNPSWHS